MTPRPGMFSPSIPQFQIAWDSTSLGLLKECPKKYEYQILQNYAPRGANVHLTFGLLYHASLERYDHAMASGSSHESSLRQMVRFALIASGTWSVGREDGTEVEVLPHVALNGEVSFFGSSEVLVPDVAPTFTPWPSTDPFKNRYTLLRSIIWHVEAFRDTQLETVILSNSKPAVELSFRMDAFTIAGDPILLCGHMDKLVQQKGTKYVWVLDHKTSKAPLTDHYYKSFSPHNQFTLYTIAGKVVLNQPNCQGVLVTGAQIGVGFTRFGQRPIPRAPAVLDEWLADAQYWITQAREFALANHWPMNDKSCGNYGGCAFARVCAVSPSHRKAWLEQEYDKWVWNPLVARGDI